MKNYLILLVSLFFVIQTTGGNLLNNGSFEKKLKGFKLKTLKPANKVAQTIMLSQSHATKGTSSLKLVLSKDTAESALLIRHINVNSLRNWEKFSIKAKVFFERINYEKPVNLGMSLRIRQWNRKGKYIGNAALVWLTVNTRTKTLGGSCSITGKTRKPVNKKLKFGKWYNFEAFGVLNPDAASTDFMLSAGSKNIIVYVDELMIIKQFYPVFKFVKKPASITVGTKKLVLEIEITPPRKNDKLKATFTIAKASKVLCEQTNKLTSGKQIITLPFKNIKEGKVKLTVKICDAANKILHKQKVPINVEADPFAF